jgi:hypothetical protein
MVKTRRAPADRQETLKAIKAAASQANYEETQQTVTSTKQICLRLTEREFNDLKSAYAKEGLKMASGIKMAALWLYENGFTVTKAGVIDKKETAHV